MHPTPGDSPREDDPDVQQTEQGTLDPFLGKQRSPQGARACATASRVAAKAPPTAGGTTASASPTTTQRSIDAFLASQAPPPAESDEMATRAPRAMAGLALERAIERVAVREAAAGITRDELIIIVARECEVPLEELTLVDSYISDLVLEGRLATAGERIVLARREATATKGKARAAPVPGARRVAKEGTEPRAKDGAKRGRRGRGPRGSRGG